MGKEEIVRVRGEYVAHGQPIELSGRGELETTGEEATIEFNRDIPSSVAVDEVTVEGGKSIKGRFRVK